MQACSTSSRLEYAAPGNCEPRRKRVYTPLSTTVLSNKEAYMQNDQQIPSPEIHNIVSTSKIICIPPSRSGKRYKLMTTQKKGSCQNNDECSACINLDTIHETLFNSHYDKKRFAAITIRIDDPVVTALLFTSGRLVITGSKCWYECMLASLIIVRMIQEVCTTQHSCEAVP